MVVRFSDRLEIRGTLFIFRCFFVWYFRYHQWILYLKAAFRKMVKLNRSSDCSRKIQRFDKKNRRQNITTLPGTICSLEKQPGILPSLPSHKAAIGHCSNIVLLLFPFSDRAQSLQSPWSLTSQSSDRPFLLRSSPSSFVLLVILRTLSHHSIECGAPLEKGKERQQ